MLKLQYFGHLMQRAYSLKKILMLAKIEGRRRRGQGRKKWLEGITDSMDLSLSKFQEMVKNREAWPAAIHGAAKSRTRLSDRTKKASSKHENLENSAVATGLEKFSFHSNPKERQCQRMLKLLHSCTHLTC